MPQAIVAGFEAFGPGMEPGARIVAAMAAGFAAGGEAVPIRSRGLLEVDAVSWPVADFQADWHDAPPGGLARLWAVWRPQLADYVARALDPASAPACGVAGDP